MSLKTKSFINFSIFFNLCLFFPLVSEAAMAYLNDEILYVIVVLLKQLLTTFFTVPIFQIKD